jgi:hypothetical protein
MAKKGPIDKAPEGQRVDIPLPAGASQLCKSEVSEDRCAKLIAAFRSIPQYMKNKLGQLKADGEQLRMRDDLLWYLLVSSIATMGRAKACETLSTNDDLRDAIAFSALLPLNRSQRETVIRKTLAAAHVRMQGDKPAWLAANIAKIQKRYGNLASANAHMLSLRRREDKLNFIQEFDGIGEKYKQNVWMDLYDADFRNTVAADVRLKSVASKLGCDKPNQKNCEAIFRDIAAKADLDMWDVDRLLFNFKDYFMQSVDGNSAKKQVPSMA